MTEPGPAAQGPEVLCCWDVPGVGADAPVSIVAKSGQSTVIVGANGSGKSALGLWMQQNSGSGEFSEIRRLIAHRKLWFESAGPGITSAARESTRANVINWSRQHESRYLDHADSQRASIVLFGPIDVTSSDS